MGMIFFSPGFSVKRTAIAPASFSLSLTHDLSSFGKPAILAKTAPTPLCRRHAPEMWSGS